MMGVFNQIPSFGIYWNTPQYTPLHTGTGIKTLTPLNQTLRNLFIHKFLAL